METLPDKCVQPSPRYTLAHYGVSNGTKIQALKVLFNNDDGITAMVFDLGWDFPSSTRDYLDATCFVCNGGQILHWVDYHRVFSPFFKTEDGDTTYSVMHSGDVVRPSGTGCDHRIIVNTNVLPPEVDRLYFTLSAYDAKNIGAFKRTTMAIFQETEDHECKQVMEPYQFPRAQGQQAVIMCLLQRKQDDHEVWEALSVEQFSAGNAKNYNALMATIRAMP